MNNEFPNNIVNEIFDCVFNQSNNLSIEQIQSKFAYDVELPKEVKDSTTGESTWAISINPSRFITQSNSESRDTWLLPQKEIHDLEELLEIWQTINYTTTERNYNSINVQKSDTIYESENVYRSANCNQCKNIIFCDGCHASNYVLASKRSGNCNYCIRVDDSANCSNSYNVICSGNIINSLYIQDCNSLYECMFCSHISNQKYCIANMQFEKEEYFAIKEQIIAWILNS